MSFYIRNVFFVMNLLAFCQIISMNFLQDIILPRINIWQLIKPLTVLSADDTRSILVLGDKCILKLIGRHLLGVLSDNDTEEEFLNAMTCFSPNKYFIYLELLRKNSKKTMRDNEEFLHFFNGYYLCNEKKLDPLDLCTHLKINYYLNKKINTGAILSLKEYAYLSQLDKKYSLNLKDRRVWVENTTKELLDLVKDDFVEGMVVGNIWIIVSSFCANIFMGKAFSGDMLMSCILYAQPLSVLFSLWYVKSCLHILPNSKLL